MLFLVSYWYVCGMHWFFFVIFGMFNSSTWIMTLVRNFGFGLFDFFWYVEKMLCLCFTHLFLHRTRYLSKAMVVMVKALQLKAQAHRNIQGVISALIKYMSPVKRKQQIVIKSNTARTIIKQLNLTFRSFCLNRWIMAMLLKTPMRAKIKHSTIKVIWSTLKELDSDDSMILFLFSEEFW